jgi:hypothetical protein
MALLVSLLEPGAREQYIRANGSGRKLPAQYVLERIKLKAKDDCTDQPSNNAAHSVLTYLQRAGATPIIRGLSFRRTESKVGTKIFVRAANGDDELSINDKSRIVLSDVKDLLNLKLQEFRVNELKAAVGM